MVLVGTSQGSLLIFDQRTGSLKCLCQGIITGAISRIYMSQQRLVCFSNNVNIYFWEFLKGQPLSGQQLNLEHFIQKIQEKPNVLTVESLPTHVSQHLLGEDLNNMLVVTRSGVLWMLDFEE